MRTSPPVGNPGTLVADATTAPGMADGARLLKHV
jgi:hypothetical protein